MGRPTYGSDRDSLSGIHYNRLLKEELMTIWQVRFAPKHQLYDVPSTMSFDSAYKANKEAAKHKESKYHYVDVVRVDVK